MERYLRDEAHRLSLPVELHIGTAETLPVAENSVDAVISTLVLCSVSSQQRTLQDVLRVLTAIIVSPQIVGAAIKAG